MDQMTVFYLHPCAKVSADWLHDKMLSIMAVESQQVMASAIQYLFLESDERLPSPRMFNNAWTTWAMQSSDHMEWLLAYYQCCVEKIETAFNRVDRSWKFQIAVRDWIPLFPRNGWVDPPCVVPVDCLDGQICSSYRSYYLKAKCRGGSYKRVRMPYWVRDHYDRPDEPEEIPVDSADYPGIIEA